MDTFSDYESFDGLGLANLVQSQVITPSELLEAAIERIEQKNPALNAVIHKMYDQARATVQQITISQSSKVKTKTNHKAKNQT